MTDWQLIAFAFVCVIAGACFGYFVAFVRVAADEQDMWQRGYDAALDDAAKYGSAVSCLRKGGGL